MKDSLKVRFMQGREGEEFEGIISGVTAFGIFVELGDIFVEGLLRLTSLTDDYYEFHEKGYMLQGKRTNRVFKLGEPITVRVEHVNLESRQIELVLPGTPPRYGAKVAKFPKGGRGGSKRGGKAGGRPRGGGKRRR